jgi:hypothetical protein
VTRAGRCAECDVDFTYKWIRAEHKYCSARCCEKARRGRHLARTKKMRAAPPSGVKCATEGCAESVMYYRGLGLCNPCYTYTKKSRYSLFQRVGRVTRPLSGSITTNGYRMVYEPSHPLSNRKGLLLEHRKVAYAASSGVCPPCFWCDVPIDWEDASVDHLNEQKLDNSPANLVVTCTPCNRYRGATLPFLRRIRPDAFDTFCALAKKQLRVPVEADQRETLDAVFSDRPHKEFI